MGKSIVITLLVLAATVSFPAISSAHNGVLGINNNSRVELKVDNENEHGKIEAENEMESNVRVQGREFELKGEISSITGNTFVVLEQTITIDPSRVEEFKQKGILEVNKKVKVEGVVEDDGTKLAEEIEVIGTGQGRFKFEAEDDKVFPTGTMSAEIKNDSNVKIKTNASLSKVLEFLQHVIVLLKGLA